MYQQSRAKCDDMKAQSPNRKTTTGGWMLATFGKGERMSRDMGRNSRVHDLIRGKDRGRGKESSCHQYKEKGDRPVTRQSARLI